MCNKCAPLVQFCTLLSCIVKVIKYINMIVVTCDDMTGEMLNVAICFLYPIRRNTPRDASGNRHEAHMHEYLKPTYTTSK